MMDIFYRFDSVLNLPSILLLLNLPHGYVTFRFIYIVLQVMMMASVSPSLSGVLSSTILNSSRAPRIFSSVDGSRLAPLIYFSSSSASVSSSTSTVSATGFLSTSRLSRVSLTSHYVNTRTHIRDVQRRGSAFLFSTSSSSSSSSSSVAVASSPIICAECSAKASPSPHYAFFCAECAAILPVDRSKTYFQVLNTSATYDVDARALSLFKRHLMKKLHPDKFAGSSPGQLRLAEDQSALVNEAAAVLSNPYERGVYLLKINGSEIGEGTKPELGKEFLMELMELNEEAEELAEAAEAEKMMKRVARIVASMERELSEAFSGGSFEHASTFYTTFDLDEAKIILEKIKFFLNLEDKLREKLTGL